MNMEKEYISPARRIMDRITENLRALFKRTTNTPVNMSEFYELVHGVLIVDLIVAVLVFAMFVLITVFVIMRLLFW